MPVGCLRFFGFCFFSALFLNQNKTIDFEVFCCCCFITNKNTPYCLRMTWFPPVVYWCVARLYYAKRLYNDPAGRTWSMQSKRALKTVFERQMRNASNRNAYIPTAAAAISMKKFNGFWNCIDFKSMPFFCYCCYCCCCCSSSESCTRETNWITSEMNCEHTGCCCYHNP